MFKGLKSLIDEEISYNKHFTITSMENTFEDFINLEKIEVKECDLRIFKSIKRYIYHY